MGNAFFNAGERVLLECDRPCVFNGHRFRKGDCIEILLNEDWDTQDGIGSGGPWGWGGYTHTQIKRVAASVTDDTGNLIYRRRKLKSYRQCEKAWYNERRKIDGRWCTVKMLHTNICARCSRLSGCQAKINVAVHRTLTGRP